MRHKIWEYIQEKKEKRIGLSRHSFTFILFYSSRPNIFNAGHSSLFLHCGISYYFFTEVKYESTSSTTGFDSIVTVYVCFSLMFNIHLRLKIIVEYNCNIVSKLFFKQTMLKYENAGTQFKGHPVLYYFPKCCVFSSKEEQKMQQSISNLHFWCKTGLAGEVAYIRYDSVGLLYLCSNKFALMIVTCIISLYSVVWINELNYNSLIKIFLFGLNKGFGYMILINCCIFN